MRKNDSKVIEAVARAAGLSTESFSVEDDRGCTMINHPDSMRWSKEVQAAVEAAATRLTGLPSSIT